jgi:hypothetical protein
MTVGQLLRSIDSAELTEWMAYTALQAEKEQPVDDAEAWRKAFQAYG